MGGVLRSLEVDAVLALDGVEEGGVHAASSCRTALHERPTGSCSWRTACRPLPEPSRIPSTTASTSLHTSAGRSGEISGHGHPVRISRFPSIRASKPRRARTRTSSSFASPGPAAATALRPQRAPSRRSARGSGLRRAQGSAEQLRHRQEALVRDGPVLPEAEDGAGAARLVRRLRVALDEAVRLEGAHVGAGGVGVDAGRLRQVLEGGGAARREPANEPGANGISDCIDHGNHFLQKIVGNSPRRCVADADPGQRGGRRAHIDAICIRQADADSLDPASTWRGRRARGPRSPA